MWSQNWEIYRKMFFPMLDFDLDDTIKKSNWSAYDMVERADDFYRSMGLPTMTDTFWEKSIIGSDSKSCSFHGSAANMFNNDDYR